MLSTTNTIDDIKSELESYGFYGYESDNDFETGLSYAVEKARKLWMLKYIPDAWYDAIAVKNKVGLTEYEDYIYEAEICFSIVEFMNLRARKIMFTRRSARETETVAGVSRSNSGPLGPEMVSTEYIRRGREFLRKAGIDISIRMNRRFPAFSQDYITGLENVQNS